VRISATLLQLSEQICMGVCMKLLTFVKRACDLRWRTVFVYLRKRKQESPW
jgi:hypothetical protein